MLTLNQAEILRLSGFTEGEIQSIDSAASPSGQSQPRVDLTTGQWRAAINSRREWLRAFMATGKTREQFDNVVNHYYERRARRKTDIWAFLKAEYKPPARMDFQAAYKARRSKSPSERYATLSTRRYAASTVKVAARGANYNG